VGTIKLIDPLINSLSMHVAAWSINRYCLAFRLPPVGVAVVQLATFKFKAAVKYTLLPVFGSLLFDQQVQALWYEL
jgi:hypothetical protein